jgi:hypothetical protein
MPRKTRKAILALGLGVAAAVTAVPANAKTLVIWYDYSGVVTGQSLQLDSGLICWSWGAPGPFFSWNYLGSDNETCTYP